MNVHRTLFRIRRTVVAWKSEQKRRPKQDCPLFLSLRFFFPGKRKSKTREYFGRENDRLRTRLQNHSWSVLLEKIKKGTKSTVFLLLGHDSASKTKNTNENFVISPPQDGFWNDTFGFRNAQSHSENKCTGIITSPCRVCPPRPTLSGETLCRKNKKKGGWLWLRPR